MQHSKQNYRRTLIKRRTEYLPGTNWKVKSIFCRTENYYHHHRKVQLWPLYSRNVLGNGNQLEWKCAKQCNIIIRKSAQVENASQFYLKDVLKKFCLPSQILETPFREAYSTRNTVIKYARSYPQAKLLRIDQIYSAKQAAPLYT